MDEKAYALEEIAPQVFAFTKMGYAAWMKALNSNSIKQSELLQLQAEMGIEFEDLCRVLNLPENYASISGGATLPFHSIDILHDLLHIYAKGYAVWEDREKFNSWMNRKNPYLFDATPIEACATRIGINEVRSEIDRVTFGIS